MEQLVSIVDRHEPLDNTTQHDNVDNDFTLPELVVYKAWQGR